MSIIAPPPHTKAVPLVRWFATGSEDACLGHRSDVANDRISMANALLSHPVRMAESHVRAAIAVASGSPARNATIRSSASLLLSP